MIDGLKLVPETRTEIGLDLGLVKCIGLSERLDSTEHHHSPKDDPKGCRWQQLQQAEETLSLDHSVFMAPPCLVAHHVNRSSCRQ